VHTFRVLDDQIGLVPAAVARTLGAVDTARGREDAFRMQRPQLLDALIDVASVCSATAAAPSRPRSSASSASGSRTSSRSPMFATPRSARAIR
jgi:hypothetical protein